MIIPHCNNTYEERDNRNSHFCSCSPRDCENEREAPEGGDNWWKRRWKLKRGDGKEDLLRDHYHYFPYSTMAKDHGDNIDTFFLPLTSSSSSSVKSEPSKPHHPLNHDEYEFMPRTYKTLSSISYCNLKSRKSDIISKLLRPFSRVMIKRQKSQSMSLSAIVTFFTNFLVIMLAAAAFLPQSVKSFPTSDCDWIGSGTPENVVQAVYLRCQQGQILWERPRGGLRVNISPPPYTYRSSFSSEQPFRLCLESNIGSNFQVFLEQPGSDEDRKLLPFLSPESSTCYRISTPTATLYVESQNQHQDSSNSDGKGSSSSGTLYKEAYQVKISYEIEELKSSQGGSLADDECRPCSDQEVLQLYCVADVVAKGEILSVKPSSTRKGMDTLHIKSTLVIHQNHPVFQPLKPGNKNLQKFLSQDIHTFDQDSPKKIPKSKNYKNFGGIVSHPMKCAAQSGPGDFLWLVKLSFGRPKIGCVVYWDKWVQIAKEAIQSESANCPLSY